MKKGKDRPQPPAAIGAGFLLAQLGAHAAAQFGQRLSTLQLDPPHAGILRAVGAAEGLSQKALAERLGIVPSRLVDLLDELAQRGLIERRDDRDDRRVYALHLTGQGALALESIARVGREHQQALLASLNARERETLTTLLRRIAEQQGLTPGVHPGFARMRTRRR